MFVIYFGHTLGAEELEMVCQAVFTCAQAHAMYGNVLKYAALTGCTGTQSAILQCAL